MTFRKNEQVYILTDSEMFQLKYDKSATFKFYGALS